ncbi:MAG TPA: permease-like cell division protein FtsX [Geobacteraceae bacterium]|nr:permease-like cell division protein FtsX [Geobacteraceae bacterium]
MPRNNVAKRPRLTNERFTGRMIYYTARALANIRQNMLLGVLTVGTITLALLIIALFLLVFVNLEGVTEDWSRRVQVTAYFDRELNPQEVVAFKAKIAALSGADRVEYVSREEAARRFRARLKGQESLLEGVSAEVLPSSLEISLRKESRNSVAVAAFVAGLKKVPGIGEVQYGDEWVKRFSAFMNFLRLVGALLGGFLLMAVLFIVSNTIKLTIYARKDELEVLGLVGATRFFIKAPFLIEGILHGAVGALLAIAILTACYYGFMHNAGNFLSFDPAETGLSFLSPGYLAGLLCGGVMIGFLGSLTSLKRFIS